MGRTERKEETEMKPTSDRTNDDGNLVAGIAILTLIASLVLIVCCSYAIALSHYADSARGEFLARIEANNEIH